MFNYAPAPLQGGEPIGAVPQQQFASLDELARRRKLAEAFLQSGMDSSPTTAHSVGINRLAQALLGGLMAGDADRRERAAKQDFNRVLTALLGGSAPEGASPAGVASPGPVPGLPAPTPAPMPSASPTPPAMPKPDPAQAPIGSTMPPVDPAAVPPGMSQVPDQPAAPGAPVPAGGLPRGIRNNNPLNIEAGAFTAGLPGFSGSDGRFAKFETPDQGIAAADKLLDVYGRRHGLNTVAGVVNRWAPAASDGNPVSAYAGFVANQIGVEPNAPINMGDPETRRKLIAAMGQFENGRPIQMALAGPQGGPQRAEPRPAPAAAPGPNAGLPGVAQPPATGISPDRKALILALMSNPYGQQLGTQMLMAQLGKSPQWEKLNDGMLFEKTSGRTKGLDGSTGSAYRPLITPEDRARYGIPPGDTRPYQVDPAGKLINPPPETRVNVDQRGESEFAKGAAKHQTERFNDLVKQGMDANAMIADINALREIGSRIGTGQEANIKKQIGPWADMLGIKIDGLSDIQAYSAIISRMAPRMRPPGSGATSDFEMRTFLDALPGLGKTPEGNQVIANTLESLQRHRVAAGEIGSLSLSGEITAKEAEKRLRELPDPMELWRRYNRGASPASSPAKPGASPAQRMPAAGDIVDGYRFKGGNPNDRNAWEKVN